MRRMQTVVGVLFAAVALCALGGCGGNSSASSPPDSSASGVAASSPDQGQVARGAALAAYEGMWQAEQTAALTADWQSPVLAQYAGGSALSVLVRGLYSLQLQHLVIKGHLVVNADVTSSTPAADPTSAQIRDCSDDTHWLVYKQSGGLQDNVPGGHRHVTATVSDSSGTWKVTELNTGAEGTC